jgi:hypothetical protein
MCDLAAKIGQLSGPALSAKSLADWMLQRKDHFSAPLKTVRLLASPSPTEKGSASEGIMPATVNNVAKALTGWREDASEREDRRDISVLYFAGHGCKRSMSEGILLLADFLSGNKLLDCSIDVSEIYNGMASSNLQPKVAQTQLYFFDCCRVEYEDLENVGSKCANIWDVELPDNKPRTAPIFFAAEPGQTANNIKDEGTAFGQRLLNCLKNDAAEAIEINGQQKWAVTIGKLAQTMLKMAQLTNDAANANVDSSIIDKWGNLQTVIHWLHEPPQVNCIFRFNPSSLRNRCSMIRLNDYSQPVLEISPPLNDPHRKVITAANYTVEVQPIEDFKTSKFNRFLLPPVHEITLQ